MCVRDVCVDEPINGQDTEAESTVGGPGCTLDPSGVVDKVQAASSGTVGAYRGTGVPLDNPQVDTQRVPVVFRKRHT